jgi:hypothetical protein
MTPTVPWRAASAVPWATSRTIPRTGACPVCSYDSSFSFTAVAAAAASNDAFIFFWVLGISLSWLIVCCLLCGSWGLVIVVVNTWLVDKKLKTNLTCVRTVFSYVAYVVVKNWL